VASLSEILTSIRRRLDRKEELRETSLAVGTAINSRKCCLIKNAHRKEWDEAQNRRKVLLEAVSDLKVKLAEAPELWFAGFVQDALKEVAEACIVYALLRDEPVPSPEDLGIDDAPYLNGLLEAMGELRRATLTQFVLKICQPLKSSSPSWTKFTLRL
jgi:translin